MNSPVLLQTFLDDKKNIYNKSKLNRLKFFYKNFFTKTGLQKNVITIFKMELFATIISSVNLLTIAATGSIWQVAQLLDLPLVPSLPNLIPKKRLNSI